MPFFVNRNTNYIKKGSRNKNPYSYKKNNSKQWRIFTKIKRYYICGKPKYRFFNYMEKKVMFPRTENPGLLKRNRRGNNQCVVTGENKRNIKKYKQIKIAKYY